MIRQVLNIAKKEFILLRRDRRMYPILFIAPIVQLILFGYAATFDVKNVPVAVYSNDNGSIARRYLEMFTASENFVITQNASNINELEKAIISGPAKLGVVIPSDFSKNIRRGKTGAVQFLVDGADSNTGIIVLNYAKAITQAFNEETATTLNSWKRRAMHLLFPRIAFDPRIRVLYNPELRSADFMLPGVVVIVLFVTTTILTAMSIVKEKELGTMEQIIVTPLKPAEVIAGKLLPFIIIGFLELGIVLSAGATIFNVSVKGSVPLLFCLSGIFILTTLGLGIFISTITHTQQQSMTMAFFIIVPMVLLSGFIYPIKNMPEAIQYLTFVIPLRYFLVIIRGIFLKGAGIGVLWDEALILLIIGLFIISVSILRFNKRLA